MIDECGGLRRDSSGWDDYESLSCILRSWVQVDHLKKFKLVITCRPENRITQIFPDFISTYVNIPSLVVMFNQEIVHLMTSEDPSSPGSMRVEV